MMDLTYSKEWVTDEIWANHKSYTNKEAVIIGIYTISDIDHFIPLRKVKLLNLNIEGTIMHINFLLSDEWAVCESLRNCNDLICQFTDIPKREKGETKHSGGKFLQIQNKNTFNYSKEIEAWEGLIKNIGLQEEFNKGIFYRFVNIRDSSGGKKKIKKMDNTYGYELVEGHSYLAEISFNFGKEPPNNSEYSYFRIYGPELRIVPQNRCLEFRIYKNDFIISIPESPNNVRTLLLMKIEHINIEPQIEGPFLEIPIKLKRSKKRYISYVLIFIGLLIIISSDYVYLFIKDPNPTMIFVVKIIGTFVTLGGLRILK